jgi:hypothetical protein
MSCFDSPLTSSVPDSRNCRWAKHLTESASWAEFLFCIYGSNKKKQMLTILTRTRENLVVLIAKVNSILIQAATSSLWAHKFALCLQYFFFGSFIAPIVTFLAHKFNPLSLLHTQVYWSNWQFYGRQNHNKWTMVSRFPIMKFSIDWMLLHAYSKLKLRGPALMKTLANKY